MGQDILCGRYKTCNPHWTVSLCSNKNHFPLGHTSRTAAPGLVLALARSAKTRFSYSQMSESSWVLTGTHTLSLCVVQLVHGSDVGVLSCWETLTTVRRPTSLKVFAPLVISTSLPLNGTILSISRALQVGLEFSGCCLFFYFNHWATVRWIITSASFKALLHVAIH